MPLLLLLTIIGSIVAIIGLAAAFMALDERFPTEHVRLTRWRREDPDKPDGQALPLSIDRSVSQLRRAPVNEYEWRSLQSRLDEIGRRFEEPKYATLLPVVKQRRNSWHIWSPKLKLTDEGLPAAYNEVWLDARLAQLETHIASTASRSTQSRQQPIPVPPDEAAPTLSSQSLPRRRTLS